MSDKDIIIKDYDDNYLYPRTYKDYGGNVVHETYVNKAGDTMTGNLAISRSDSAIPRLSITPTELSGLSGVTGGNEAMFIGFSNSGTYQSLYSRGYYDGSSWNVSGSHMIYRDSSGNVYVNGNASTATKWATARTITNTGDISYNYSLDGSSNISNSTFINYCYANRSNSNTTYAYHRIATIGPISTNYYDASAIILIDQGFHGGGYGIARIILRTNNVSASADPNVELTWLVRKGLSTNSLQYGLYNNSGTATFDIYYYATGTYNSAMIRFLQSYRGNAANRFTLVNSSAKGTGASGTNTTNNEVYTGINAITYTSTGTASESGYVNQSGEAIYPTGFSSRTAGAASWGNTTGTSITCWNEPNGGSIDFRQDNPSTGKLSVKVDGRFYFNEGATPCAGLAKSGNYWGMTGPDGETNIWIRSTSKGIIPYEAADSGSGSCYLGTSSFYWGKAYIDTIYGTTFSGNAATATTATKLGSSTVGGAAKPIYLNSGTATACSSTVGNASTPIYLSSGEATTANSATSISNAVSKTSGCAVKSQVFYYYGRVGHLRVTFNGGSSSYDSSHSRYTAFTGTLNSTYMSSYIPKASTMGCSYVMGYHIIGWLDDTGAITIVSDGPTDYDFTISWTYIF